MARHDQELRFGYLIHDVSRLRRTLFDRWLLPLGITRSQWWVLAFLARNDGMARTELAAELDVGKVALGALIDRLEIAGFVVRRHDPADRRLRRIFQTPDGNALLLRLRSRNRDFNQRIMDDITSAEIDVTIRTLAAIKATLSETTQQDPQGGTPEELHKDPRRTVTT